MSARRPRNDDERPGLRKSTTRQKAKESNGELVIAFRPFVAAYVKLAHRRGLYGIDVASAADRLMCYAIEHEVKHGHLPYMEPDGEGGLVMGTYKSSLDADLLRNLSGRTTALHEDERAQLREIAARVEQYRADAPASLATKHREKRGGPP